MWSKHHANIMGTPNSVTQAKQKIQIHCTSASANSTANIYVAKN